MPSCSACSYRPHHHVIPASLEATPRVAFSHFYQFPVGYLYNDTQSHGGVCNHVVHRPNAMVLVHIGAVSARCGDIRPSRPRAVGFAAASLYAALSSPFDGCRRHNYGHDCCTGPYGARPGPACGLFDRNEGRNRISTTNKCISLSVPRGRPYYLQLERIHQRYLLLWQHLVS